MKNVAACSFFLLATLGRSATPSHAWHGGWHHGPRVHAGWGPPWWYYPRPYYVYSPPPTVVVEQPPVYVQQQPQATPAPPPPPPPPPPAPSAPSSQPTTYWYYCPGAKAYYPDVPTCSEAWIKVPPRG